MTEPILTEIALSGMTHEKWSVLSKSERDRIADISGLTEQLGLYLGCRVECVRHSGEVVRFWVGCSTGWRPAHLEIKTSRSLGGSLADKSYKSVKFIKNGNK